MSKIDVSWKISDLKKECSKYKLPTYGTKAVLVKRIKEYLKENVKEFDGEDQVNEDHDDENALNECTINLSNNNNNDNNSNKCQSESLDDDSLDDEDDENNVDQINQNGKRVRLTKLHEFEKHCETLEQAEEIIASENTWNFQRTRRTTEGLKYVYYCKAQCDSKLYILLDNDDLISIWRNNIDHDHQTKKSFGINKITKLEIAKLVTSNKTPTRILNALRERFEPYLPKKKETDEFVNNPLYVPGLEIPTYQQISNYLSNTLRPKLYGKKDFSYADLAKFVLGN
jgi:hypothetical protein